jgi:hypothetical protein
MSRLHRVLFSGISAYPSGIFLLIFALSLSFFSVGAQVNIAINQGMPANSGGVYGIAYGNGVYIGIGVDQTMLRSTDGQHFKVIRSSQCRCGDELLQIVFANGLFLAIGKNGITLTSTDGFTWNGGDLPVTITDPNHPIFPQGLIYAGGQWMALVGNYILTSPDAITWTEQAFGYPGVGNFVDLVYKDGKYIIGASDGSHSYFIYSSTGIGNSWTKVDTLLNSGLSKFQLLNNTLYAFTSSGIIDTSADITHWAAITDTRLSRSPGAPYYNIPIEGGLYTNGIYYLYGFDVIDGSADNFQPNIYTSTDGITWTLKPQNGAKVDGPISYVNGYFYRFTKSYGTAYSTDAAGWTIIDGNYAAVATNGSLYVTVGGTAFNQDGIFTSPDWSDPWTSRTLYNVTPLNAVTYGNGKFVAVGNQDTANMIGNFATSADGINWTAGYAPISYDMRGIAYGNGKFVAVGAYGEIDYSSDGINWTKANTEMYNYYFAISYLNGFFVAVGGGPYYELNTPMVKYSADGVTWTDVSPNIRANSWGIAYGDGKYVLVGGANAGIGDIDTTTFWSMTTTDITNVNAWSAPSFSVTPFLPTLANLGSGPGSVDYPYRPPVYGGLAYGNGQFVAVSELAAPAFALSYALSYVLNSSDGLNWTATNVPVNTDLKGIIYTGSNTFKAVGSGATLLNITVGTPLPLTLLSFTGRQEGDKNILSWQTSDEVNTKEFVIEWSGDGHTYLPIGTVVAASHSTGTLSYSYTHDPAPAGNDFYRLRMVDLDGHFTYSNIVQLNVAGSMAPLNVWPNPVRGGTVTIGAPSAALPLTCTIYDADGKIIRQELLTQLPRTLDVSGLSRGTYTLAFSNGIVKKLVRL